MKKNDIIFDEQGLEINDCVKCDNTVVFISSSIVGKCKRCGSPVVREMHNSIGYPFFCPSCMENKYSFECNLNKLGKDIASRYNRDYAKDLPEEFVKRYDFYIPKELLKVGSKVFIRDEKKKCIVEAKVVSFSITVKDYGVYAEILYRDCEGHSDSINSICKDRRFRVFKNENDAITGNEIHHERMNICEILNNLGYSVEHIKIQYERLSIVTYAWNVASVKKVQCPFSMMKISSDSNGNMKFCAFMSVSQGMKLYRTIEECKKDNKVVIKKFKGDE